MSETRTRSGRVSKPPTRYEPVENVTDDYADDDYDEDDPNGENDESDDDEESDDEESDEEETESLKDFIVDDEDEEEA